jgi:hypothetical protein
MSDLIVHLDKLHTNPLGVERVRKNLGLEAPDVVTWCNEKTAKADKIIRQGKNWYVHTDDAVSP